MAKLPVLLSPAVLNPNEESFSDGRQPSQMESCLSALRALVPTLGVTGATLMTPQVHTLTVLMERGKVERFPPPQGCLSSLEMAPHCQKARCKNKKSEMVHCSILLLLQIALAELDI